MSALATRHVLHRAVVVREVLALLVVLDGQVRGVAPGVALARWSCGVDGAARATAAMVVCKVLKRRCQDAELRGLSREAPLDHVCARRTRGGVSVPRFAFILHFYPVRARHAARRFSWRWLSRRRLPLPVVLLPSAPRAGVRARFATGNCMRPLRRRFPRGLFSSRSRHDTNGRYVD